MRTVIGFTLGFITALYIASHVIQPITLETVHQLPDTVIVDEVMTTIDLDRLRDTSDVSEHDEQLLAECAYAIQRRTDEPLAGIVIYVARRWQGDACAALEHLLRHDWY